MENVNIFTGKHYLPLLVKTDNLNSYLSWMKNSLDNRYILSVKDNSSINELDAFIDYCNKDQNNVLLEIYDKKNNNHIGNIKYDNINIINKSPYLDISLREQEYKRVGVARQTITISIKWFNENFGIENILLGLDNSNVHALKLYQKLVFGVLQIKAKNGYSWI